MNNKNLKQLALRVVLTGAVTGWLTAVGFGQGPLGPLNPPTRLFSGSVADIPFDVPAETANAYYDPATGDVIVVLGEGLAGLGILGEPVSSSRLEGDFGGFNHLPSPSQFDGFGIFFFRPAGLIFGINPDSGIFEQGIAGGPFNLGALLPTGLTTPAKFNAAFGQTDELANVYVGTTLVRGGSTEQGFQILSVPEPGCVVLLAAFAIARFTSRRPFLRSTHG